MVAVKMPRNRGGFSLVELMVVMVIVIGIMALAAPAFKTVTMGSAVIRGAQVLSDQFAWAQQEAVGKNTEVQVRLIWLDSGTPGYKAVQLWVPSGNDVTSYVPAGKMVMLPPEVLMSSSGQLSPLIRDATIPETNGTFPGLGSLRYCGFRFRPGGGTDLVFGSTGNYITVVRNQDASADSAPSNYATVQLEAENGRARIYRP